MFRLAFFGDVVGLPGTKAFAHAAAHVRQELRADLVIVNGENMKNGSGITPDGYKELRRAGADAITLGDHCFKDKRICDFLDDPEKSIARPANLSTLARGKRAVRVLQRTDAEPAPGRWATPELPPVFVVTVLGRLFMPIPANDPFESINREVVNIELEHPEALVVVEVHAEATSEKQAIAWHCLRTWPRRVVAVVGTHTHVPTADERVVDGRLAVITDLGMCGGYRGVIGRKIDPVLSMMTRQDPLAYEVADEECAAAGVLIDIDEKERIAQKIERVRMPLDNPHAA